MNQAGLFDDAHVTIGTAQFSLCGLYRYELTRRWVLEPKRMLACVGLNPSIATAEVDDPTVAKLSRLARRLGLDGLVMLNLYAYRSTDPRGLREVADPVGPSNDASLTAWFEKREHRLLLCWGANADHERARRVAKLALAVHGRPECLVVTKDGHPGHPLYIPDATDPLPFPGYGGEP